jgi:tRNA-dihydrouridine synthase
VQKYLGSADHSITRDVVAATSIPVIANGDVTTAGQGREVLEYTGAAGLMLGRGAIGDPWLFRRLRDCKTLDSDPDQRCAQLRIYLARLRDECRISYAGEHQTLAKLKNVVQFIEDEELQRWCGKLKRTRSLLRFSQLVDSLEIAVAK